MVDYYGENGMKQAFDNLKRRYQENRAYDMASAADHVMILNVPDSGSSSSNSTASRPGPVADSGFKDMADDNEIGDEYHDERLQSRQTSFRPGDRLETYSNPDTGNPSMVFATAEDKRSNVYETENERYDRLNPERDNPYADTNGDENATFNWSKCYNPVTGETYYKRPIRGIV